MQSPRLKALAADLAAGRGESLAVFWDAIRMEGTPVVEPIDGNSDHFLTTFLWQGNEEMRRIHVLSGVAGWGFYDTQLARLPGTDLWYRTYRVRGGARFGYYFVQDMDYPTWERGITTNEWPPLQVDPLCRRPFPTAERAFVAIAELPGAPEQPWTRDQPDVPKGQVTMHSFKSEILGNERKVWVYTPPGYASDGEPYGLLILFDGGLYVAQVIIPTPEILDNLLAARRIPPLVAVFIGNANRAKELPCNDAFVESLADELVPWVHRSYHVSTDPARTIIGGSSYGGLAAAFAALRRPAIFGNVLSQSGSYWWYPEYPNQAPGVEPGWLIRAYRDAERLPLRFYLDVGVFERSPDPRHPDQVALNRQMRDVLVGKGYPVHYTEFHGGHDYVCWAGTVSDGIVCLTNPPQGTVVVRPC